MVRHLWSKAATVTLTVAAFSGLAMAPGTAYADGSGGAQISFCADKDRPSISVQGYNQYGKWTKWGPYSIKKGNCYMTTGYRWQSGDNPGYFIPAYDLPEDDCPIPQGTTGTYKCPKLEFWHG